MRISHRHRFVFLSKYKSASTSVRAALDPVSDVLSSQRYPFYHHTPLVPLKRHFETVGWPWERYFVFTTVRHPVSMLASLYSYGRPDQDGSYWWERHWPRVVSGDRVPEEEWAAPNPVSFREWILTHDFSRFCLDPFVFDENGDLAAAAVLKVENLAEDLAAVAAKLGLEGLELPHLNHRRKPIPPSVDPKMLARIRTVFATDIEHGKYTL